MGIWTALLTSDLKAFHRVFLTDRSFSITNTQRATPWMVIISNMPRVPIKCTQPSINITWYLVDHKWFLALIKGILVMRILKCTQTLLEIILNININRTLMLLSTRVIPMCHPAPSQLVWCLLVPKQWGAQLTSQHHRVLIQEEPVMCLAVTSKIQTRVSSRPPRDFKLQKGKRAGNLV